MHWAEVWREISADNRVRTQAPHTTLAKPYSKPQEQALTEVLTTTPRAPTTWPPVISQIEEEDINQEIIHHSQKLKTSLRNS